MSTPATAIQALSVCTLFIFFSGFQVAYAQCGNSPVITSSVNNCPGEIITVSGLNDAKKIEWMKGGTIVKTTYPTISIDTLGEFKAGFGDGTAFNMLGAPAHIFVDKLGYIYVADRGNDRVLKFPPNSSFATMAMVVAGGNGSGSGANQLSGPTAVFLDSTGA